MCHGPLEGIRVVDFGRYIAGPYCAALLGDFGAEVIRVEKKDGREDRTLVPLAENDDGSPREGAMFLQMNRNKKSLTLNPGTEKGREVIRQAGRKRRCRHRQSSRRNAQDDGAGLGHASRRSIRAPSWRWSRPSGSTGPTPIASASTAWRRR